MRTMSDDVRATTRLTRKQIDTLDILSGYDDDETTWDAPISIVTVKSLRGRNLVTIPENGPHLTPLGQDILAAYI
jgi:hypothetical protein